MGGFNMNSCHVHGTLVFSKLSASKKGLTATIRVELFNKLTKSDLPFHFISLHLLRRCTSLRGFGHGPLSFACPQYPALPASGAGARPCSPPAQYLRCKYPSLCLRHALCCGPAHSQLRCEWRPALAKLSFGSEVRSLQSIRRCPTAFPRRALTLLHDAFGFEFLLRKNTVRTRFFAYASLRSLLLRATLGLQPRRYALAPCCRPISCAGWQKSSLSGRMLYTVNIDFHSLYVQKQLSLYNVLTLSVLIRLARILDKLGKIHLLYIIRI